MKSQEVIRPEFLAVPYYTNIHPLLETFPVFAVFGISCALPAPLFPFRRLKVRSSSLERLRRGSFPGNCDLGRLYDEPPQPLA